MCDFLSAIIARNGTIYADGVSGHSELAARYLKRENGIGAQTFWEWEANPVDLPVDPLQIRQDAEPPDAVRTAAARLFGEVREANGFLPSLPDIAIFRFGEHRAVRTRQVAIACGNARVRDVLGTVQAVYDKAILENVWGDARVGGVFGNAKIEDLYNRATVEEVYQDATVSNMFGNGRVLMASGHAKIQEMRGEAMVSALADNATILGVHRNAIVQRVYGNAAVHAVSGQAIVTTYNGRCAQPTDFGVHIDRSRCVPRIVTATTKAEA